MNERYVAWFGDHRPARSAVAVAALPTRHGDFRVVAYRDALRNTKVNMRAAAGIIHRDDKVLSIRLP